MIRLDALDERVLRIVHRTTVYGSADPDGMTQDEITTRILALRRRGLVTADGRLTGAGFQAMRERGIA